jgi:putative endonuclease
VYAHRDAVIISVIPAKAGTQSCPWQEQEAVDRGMNERRPCVYILASKRNGTLYVGVTSDIARRAWQHRSNAVGGFVRDYGVHRLVFVEFHETMADAILREKRIKKWRRTWKLELIERHNPQWHDLYDQLA